MKVVHSNIDNSPTAPKKELSEFAIRMLKKRWKRTVKKNADRIKRVQQYFPDYKPEFNIENYK